MPVLTRCRASAPSSPSTAWVATIIGNGAYFGPDLTKLYAAVGPAWLEAFLPSAGAWPTSDAVKLQLQDKAIAGEAGVETIEAYLEKYPAAAERINRRGGKSTHMPNLPFSRDDVHELVAFLKYTSEMNTEGWPPVPKVDGLAFPEATPMPASARQAASSRPKEIRWPRHQYPLPPTAPSWPRKTAAPPATPRTGSAWLAPAGVASTALPSNLTTAPAWSPTTPT
jgi:hypothetical protein